jgi:hypothetical protein
VASCSPTALIKASASRAEAELYVSGEKRVVMHAAAGMVLQFLNADA